MKNTTNVFLKGMTSDMHPLTTSLLEYTDALNATLITFNGNEQMMQNDMGNTLIQDSKTGNIMGLREGFVPVGLKEHGGIMYIASVNKDGVGEIGTIPSPVIRYNKLKDYLNKLDIKWSATPSSPSNLYKITKEKLYTGDKFATILQLQDDAIITVNYIDLSGNRLNLYYPEYSYSASKEELHASNKGLYSVNLLSQTDDLIFDMSDQILPKSELFTYKIESDLDSDLNKKYWFVNLPNDYDATLISFDIDNMLALNSADSGDKLSPFITYPNIPAGYPSVLFKTENINSFELSTNDATGHVHPLTKAVVDSETKMQYYYAIFPYFVYSTDSAVHVDEIEVCVVDNEGKKYPLYKNLGDNFWSDAQSDLIFKISETGPKRYQRIENNTYDFAFALNELNSITTKTDSSFNTDDSNALFRMKIGEDLNKWYTLCVKYKSNEWENEILGEYNLKFNQFIMDIEGEFIDTRIENLTTNQIYDKSKDVDDTINFKSLYLESNSDTLNVLCTFQSSNDFLDVNIDYGEFIPITKNDVKLKYLYTLSDGNVQKLYAYDERLLRWPTLISPEITIECSKWGSDAKFWAVLNDFRDRVNRGDITIADHSYTIDVTFDVYTYILIDGHSYPTKDPGGAYGSVSVTLYSSDMQVHSTPGGAGKSLSINDGSFRITLDGRKILELILRSDTTLEKANTSFSKSRLCINNIYLSTTESNPEPYPGRHQYYLWYPRESNSYGEWYSKTSSDLYYTEDSSSTSIPGGKGFVYTSGPILKLEIEANYLVSVDYTPYPGDRYIVYNQGDYEITYQCNLEGKDRNSTAGNYIKYGMTTTTLVNSDHRMHLCQCLMNTNENKLSSIINSSDIFEPINVKNYISSFIQNIPIKKLKNNTITFPESDSVTINLGVYYLGSIIRDFRYTTNRDGSIDIGPEVIDDASIENTHNYISLTIIPQTFDGSDGAPIEIKVASSNIGNSITDDDYYEKKSGREGGILYLPYGGSITKISAVRESDDLLLLVQDIGLYEVNLKEFNIETPLHQKVINADNVAFYEPNRYFDNSSETYYGYYYISPLICWVFNENGIECAQKEFATLHFGLHAYLTNFGEYYYNRTSDYNFVILNIPNGDLITVNFRKLNNDSD